MPGYMWWRRLWLGRQHVRRVTAPAAGGTGRCGFRENARREVGVLDLTKYSIICQKF